MSSITDRPFLPSPEHVHNEIVKSSQRIALVLKDEHQNIFNLLWHSGVEPQQVLDLLGTSAATLFSCGQRAVEIILSQNPAALTPDQYQPPREVTVHEDGAVTLGAPIEPAP